jgi:TetR/AcrR family transcriptional regulator
MDEPESRQGRTRNAERTRKAILDAAEMVFAEHGFDGARFDAIAQASGYNRSLIGQYFGDKLGLYTEVVRRADKEITEISMRELTSFIEDETIASDAHRFKFFLETLIGALFDYMLEHPRLMRIIVWEQAEGWQNYAKFITQADIDDAERVRTLLHRARKAGLLRLDMDPIIQLTMAEQMCWSYLTSIHLYQMLLAGEDLSSETELARAREHIIDFIVHGMMVNPEKEVS